MNPVFKEFVIDFADLKLISVTCRKCNTEIIFDVTKADIKMPSECPCGEGYGDFFISALNGFHDAYAKFTHQKVRAMAKIRIRREANLTEF